MALKISIITPNYNQGAFLERTIQSILDQGYENLEYIVIDGGSTDNSVEIIRKYADRLAYWVSEKDQGMYDAINKGFARATGDVLGWLNSDDVLLPGALATVGEVFTSFAKVNWITGMPLSIDESDRIIGGMPAQRWSRRKVLSGDFKWIQQESTYWRRELWQRSGAGTDTAFSLAGDFELWARFFRYEKLYTVHVAMAGFRKRGQQQKSLTNYTQYLEQVAAILARERALLPGTERSKIRGIALLSAIVRKFPLGVLKRIARRVQRLPSMITVDRVTQKLTLK